ncbi:hypothetical protein R1sor_003209 [Riccia sorocarpa]|uniref:F-box domain-containing protein n=1 Tax=Riccia sorocarpa TaxID=122646 RepID=A0ABD3H0X8_9MARC
MNPKLWKRLTDHEEILQLILSCVSWDTNLRLRSVSKAFYATLSEPSLFTWSSMLTDTSFYTNHSDLNWVDGDFEDHLVHGHADAVCLFSTSQSVTYALVNFELRRWCKLPPLGDLPFGNLNDFIVTGVAEGLLLLERRISEGIHGDDSWYELDRFLFNPLTRRFIKLPVTRGGSITNVVFVGGELFLKVLTYRHGNDGIPCDGIVSFGSRTCPKDPELMCWSKPATDIYLFQHKGLLKTMNLKAGTSSFLINVLTFDCIRMWQLETIEIPRHILKSWSSNMVTLGTSNIVLVGVLGDILCLRNRREPSIFILYNFLSKQWYRCYAKELVEDGDLDFTTFLWSPDRSDSWHMTPSVR